MEEVLCSAGWQRAPLRNSDAPLCGLCRHKPLLSSPARPFSPPLHAPSLPPRRGVSSLVRLLRGRWSGTALLLVGIFPRGVAASNPLREKVRRVNLGLSSLVARESSERLLFLDAAALMPLQPDGTLDRAWTFDYVHLTNEMYARYGDALLTVLRPFVQPR